MRRGIIAASIAISTDCHDSAIERVGVIGAGTMGNGIAQACAVAGLDVVMVDVADAARRRGVADDRRAASSGC